MKKLLLSLFVFCLTSVAFAQAGDSQVTPVVNPTYTCGDDDMSLFINVPDKRVWLGDPAEKDGLEMQVSELLVGASPHSLSFKATITLFGGVANWDMTMSQQADGKVVLYGAMKAELEQDSETITIDCQIN